MLNIKFWTKFKILSERKKIKKLFWGVFLPVTTENDGR